MSTQNQSTATPLTLDSVFKAVKHWREHKKDYKSNGIPNDLWKKFFQLEENGMVSTEVKRLFSLNSQQYAKKRHELIGEAIPSNPPNAAKASIKFCEVNVKPSSGQSIPPLTQTAKTTQKTLSHLRSTDRSAEHYLDLTTLIVECIRPDGHRLKIHTTTQSLDQVMQAFFA